MASSDYKKEDGTLDEDKVLNLLKSEGIIYLSDLNRRDKSLYRHLQRNNLLGKYKLIKKPTISKFDKYSDVEVLNKFILDNKLNGVGDLQKLNGSLYNYLKVRPEVLKKAKFPMDYLIEEAREDFQKFVLKYKIRGRETLRNTFGKVLWRIVIKENLDEGVSYYNQSLKSINFERWKDYNLEKIQKYIIEHSIVGRGDFNKKERGLYNKAVTLGILDQLVFEKDNFASTWERDIYNELSIFIGKSINSIELQYKYDKCIDKACLPFDFKINLSNGNSILLEVTGPYHFCKSMQNDKGVISRFINTRKHDIIKHNFCKKNNIKLFYFAYSNNLVDKFGYPYYVYTNLKYLFRDMGII